MPRRQAELDSVIDELIACVGVNQQSLEERLAVLNFTRECILSALADSDCLVVVTTFGSVPLRSCIWDADMDVSIIARTKKGQLVSEERCNELLDIVHAHFQKVHRDAKAKMSVSEVHLIPSRVPVLKVAVGSFGLDISVNKLAGTVKLPFLEMVDGIIGRCHLFKRSLLLIKAWCAHESRLLGSSKGLLATYALEVMLMCLFNVFHDELTRPIIVLQKFLEYFSGFDWDNFCVTVCGPISKDRLAVLSQQYYGEAFNPRIEIEAASGRLIKGRGLGGSCWLDDFRSRFCYDKALDSGSFQFKLMNIIDPMCHSNNLGRSVGPHCHGRFRAALKLGLKSLRSAYKKRDADILRQMFYVSFAKGDVGVSSAICVDPVKRVVERDLSICLEEFAGHSYAVLQSDIYELVRTYLSAHPDHRRLREDLESYVNFLREARRAGKFPPLEHAPRSRKSSMSDIASLNFQPRAEKSPLLHDDFVKLGLPKSTMHYRLRSQSSLSSTTAPLSR